MQPTFVRFVFEMPDGVNVSSVLNEQKLTLSFNAALNFDLADAKLAAPANIASITQKIEGETSAVEISADRRCRCPLVPRGQEIQRRRGVPAARETRRAIAGCSALPAAAAPCNRRCGTAPAPADNRTSAAPAAPAKPPESTPAPKPAAEAAPLTSETFAKQAKIEIKPEAAPKPSPAAEARAAASPPADSRRSAESRPGWRTPPAEAKPPVEVKSPVSRACS